MLRLPVSLEEGVSFSEVIPCVGAPKIPQIVSLMLGWGFEFVVLLDNDSAGEQAKKELTEQLLIEEGMILKIHPDKGYGIEDLFTKTDFNKYIISDFEDKNNEDAELLNSAFLKKKKTSGYDKVLLSRKFFNLISNDSANDIKLNKFTLDNFRKLFSLIEDVFGEQDSGKLPQIKAVK